jgi:hypothetical protein
LVSNEQFILSIAVTSSNWTKLQNTTNIAARKSTSDKDPLLIALLIPLCLVLVIALVLTVICHRRRAACFTERERPRQVTVLHDDVVQTKLLTAHADESDV